MKEGKKVKAANIRVEPISAKPMVHFKDNRTPTKQVTQLQKLANEASSKQSFPVQKKENKMGLPNNLKDGIENLSGYSMHDVKVHYNSDKPAQLQASAYARGNQIHLGPGQEKYLPHEAWHVVQQKQGRVQPTTQLKKKVNINDDKGLEQEADVMGQKALQMVGGKSSNPTVQRMINGLVLQLGGENDNKSNNISTLKKEKEGEDAQLQDHTIMDGTFHENFLMARADQTKSRRLSVANKVAKFIRNTLNIQTSNHIKDFQKMEMEKIKNLLHKKELSYDTGHQKIIHSKIRDVIQKEFKQGLSLQSEQFDKIKNGEDLIQKALESTDAAKIFPAIYYQIGVCSNFRAIAKALVYAHSQFNPKEDQVVGITKGRHVFLVIRNPLGKVKEDKIKKGDNTPANFEDDNAVIIDAWNPDSSKWVGLINNYPVVDLRAARIDSGDMEASTTLSVLGRLILHLNEIGFQQMKINAPKNNEELKEKAVGKAEGLSNLMDYHKKHGKLPSLEQFFLSKRIEISKEIFGSTEMEEKQELLKEEDIDSYIKTLIDKSMIGKAKPVKVSANKNYLDSTVNKSSFLEVKEKHSYDEKTRSKIISTLNDFLLKHFSFETYDL
ncbi:MAG: hypothetical protein CL840_12615 [Crocinitomicaceae bacterium]|nr:hypothetical protein [Crocinitomicaceae bacterium]|tara:strand:+ start:96 stop:1925 length:1830 start_codon:yes stop_codon:yes gene_type:complete